VRELEPSGSRFLALAVYFMWFELSLRVLLGSASVVLFFSAALCFVFFVGALYHSTWHGRASSRIALEVLLWSVPYGLATVRRCLSLVLPLETEQPRRCSWFGRKV
jgi:hypothetical protein